MANEFDVVKTVEPLHQLFTSCLSTSPVRKAARAPVPGVKQAAYLIDRWPDANLPLLEMELRALQRNKVPHVAVVVHPPIASELTDRTNDLVMQFEYLPDAMVIEGEWQASTTLVRELETVRANQKHRPPSDLFLEQIRWALSLTEIAPAMQYRARACHQLPHIVRRAPLEEASRVERQRRD